MSHSGLSPSLQDSSAHPSRGPTWLDLRDHPWRPTRTRNSPREDRNPVWALPLPSPAKEEIWCRQPRAGGEVPRRRCLRASSHRPEPDAGVRCGRSASEALPDIDVRNPVRRCLTTNPRPRQGRGISDRAAPTAPLGLRTLLASDD
jgi:hypothetical protein